MSSRKEREARKAKVASSRKAAENSAGKQSKAFKLPPGVQRFKEKAGEYVLAVVGYDAGKNNPDADEGYVACRAKYTAHRGIGANMDTYLCPAATFGKPCPICDHKRDLALDLGWEDEQVKALKTSERGLWLVVDRNEEKKGIQVMDISHFAFGKLLLEKSVRKKRELFHCHESSKEGGYDVEVTFEDEKKGGMTFTKAVDIDFKERDALPDEIVDQAFDLFGCLVCLEYDELKAIFESGVGSEKEEDGEKDKEETPLAAVKADVPAAPAKAAPTSPTPQTAAKPKDEDEEEEEESEDEDEDEDDEDWGKDADEESEVPATTAKAKTGKKK